MDVRTSGPLVSIRWWQFPRIAVSVGLTAEQREIIDRTYAERMVRRRQLVAATEERALSVVLNDEIAALLSPEQRQTLAVIVPGRLVD